MEDWNEFSTADWNDLFSKLLDYASRIFAAIILLSPETERVMSGGGSALDFVSQVILDLLSGKLIWEPSKGSLLNFLKLALRADIIDHLRSPLGRVQNMEDLVDSEGLVDAQFSDSQAQEIAERIRQLVKDDPDLAKLVAVMLDLEITKPRELALKMGVPVQRIYNLRRRLVRKILRVPLR